MLVSIKNLPNHIRLQGTIPIVSDLYTAQTSEGESVEQVINTRLQTLKDDLRTALIKAAKDAGKEWSRLDINFPQNEDRLISCEGIIHTRYAPYATADTLRCSIEHAEIEYLDGNKSWLEIEISAN